ncbi:PAS domain S-box protein [Pelotomaculum isophthalicicum JI]|uniref:PAS domain S-box protein n=1 Tax=Pelotomaculum isophthalicicum JI TaxID=947010 RepID=A0A9X4JW72_9FIRM|nr:PAS domain S-box protein [Pelotomaculum isophthalicicum]MDF9408697.1 PAS domain S-box protein [Pelotomaculum isophthalicicum JI]
MATQGDQQEVLLNLAVQALEDIISNKVSVNTLPADLKSHPEFVNLYEKLAAIRGFISALANGDLSQGMRVKGFLSGGLRTLQANLRHLTWQTQMIASGDFTQRVDFMGDFSVAFNSLTKVLAKATAELKESEARYRLLAENVLDVIMVIDLAERFTYVSPSIVRLLGRTQEEIIGRTIEEVLSFDSFQALCVKLRQLLADEEVVSQGHVFELEHFNKNRQVLWIEVSVNILRDDKGKMAGIVSVVRDISERRKAERMLQIAYDLQRKSDFFNDIINGNVSIDKDAIATAKKWGIDFTIPFFCCLIDIHNPIDTQQKKRYINNLLSKNPEYVVWDIRDNIGVLLQTCHTLDILDAGIQAATQIKEKISRYAPDLIVTIGVSDMHNGPDSLEKSYQEARSAIVSAKCQLEYSGGIYCYRDIGLFQLLATYDGKERAAEYIQKLIGPLIKYDRDKGASLLLTLEIILQSNNLKEAAQKIFLHHKTLVFRKQRIEKILGVSIDHFETKLALAAAIKLHKLSNLVNN